MEGRDIGTAVFPDAHVKIFLDAAPEVRGNRRYRQVVANAPQPAALDPNDPKAKAILDEMHDRDQRDRTRSVSPLVPASDAVIIDSTSLTLDEVIAQAQAEIDAKLG